MNKVKCAYCWSDNVDYVDEVDAGKEEYYCCDCDEYFYSHYARIDGEYRLQVSKEKWKNFKTVQ